MSIHWGNVTYEYWSISVAPQSTFASHFEILWPDSATCQCILFKVTIRTKELKGLDLYMFHCLPDVYQSETLANLKKLYYGETQRTWIFFFAINRYHSLLLYPSSCQVTYLCEQNIELSSFQQRNYIVAKGTMIFISCLKKGLQTEANLEKETL